MYINTVTAHKKVHDAFLQNFLDFVFLLLENIDKQETREKIVLLC
jgi:hypothetical protein